MSKSIFIYLSYENGLTNNSKIFKYFYENNLLELENVIFEYGDFPDPVEYGGFFYYNTSNLSSYLVYMSKLNSSSFKEKILKIITNMSDILLFSAYLPYFITKRDKKDFFYIVFSRFLGLAYQGDDFKNIRAIILRFLDLEKEDKSLEDLLNNAISNYKSPKYLDFSKFIFYRKLDPKNIYDQKLVELSMSLDKYKTMDKLLFTLYNNQFKYNVSVNELDIVLGTWDIITYDDIIDFLVYHISVTYSGLDAAKILKNCFKTNFDEALNTIVKFKDKRLYDALDIFYKKSRVKTSKFILNNIEIFEDKSFIDKVVSKIQVERISNKQIETLKNHKKEHVREIANRLFNH